jgi:hypothetical protein
MPGAYPTNETSFLSKLLHDYDTVCELYPRLFAISQKQYINRRLIYGWVGVLINQAVLDRKLTCNVFYSDV